jgi:hypothetical protein
MEPDGDPSPMLFLMAMFFTWVNFVVLNFEKNRVREFFIPRYTSQAKA